MGIMEVCDAVIVVASLLKVMMFLFGNVRELGIPDIW